jgi:hypothetical protein
MEDKPLIYGPQRFCHGDIFVTTCISDSLGKKEEEEQQEEEQQQQQEEEEEEEVEEEEQQQQQQQQQQQEERTEVPEPIYAQG